MSLISFHRLLITVGIIFAGGYAIWEFTSYLDSGSVRSLFLSMIFFAGALGLGYYLRHLGRILRLSRDEQPPR